MLAGLEYTNDHSKDEYRSSDRNSYGNLQKMTPLQWPSKIYDGVKSVAKDFWRNSFLKKLFFFLLIAKKVPKYNH